VNKKTLFFSSLAGIAMWVGIIFLPPWNFRAVLYVVALVILVVVWLVIEEIYWHRKGRD